MLIHIFLLVHLCLLVLSLRPELVGHWLGAEVCLPMPLQQ